MARPRRKRARRRRASGKAKARHLFDAWPEISRRLRRSRRWALFLDFDGTLVPIRQKPGNVPLAERGRQALQRLAGRRRVRVVVISGRPARSVRGQVGVAGVRYMGQHGIESPPEPIRIGPEEEYALLLAKRAMWARLRSLPGVWLEDKGACFAVHYRGARPAVVRRAAMEVRSAVDRVPRALRILPGKKVWEVLPRFAGKGAAVRNSLSKFPGRPLTIFAGDDTTDEEAFRELRNAITIRVGSGRRTHAKYFLRSPQEVLLFLERLEALL